MKTRSIIISFSILFFLVAPVFSCDYVSGTTTLGTGYKVTQVESPEDILLLVNKSNSLPQDYVPRDLRTVNLPSVHGKDQLRDVAASALEALFKDAENSGHFLFAQSGFRSYDRQSAIFYGYVKKYGREVTETFSAPPRMSEHQTGLAMDISSKAANYALIRKFGELPEGIWVKNNAWKYGFIIRYPQDKTHITKYTYEPWHLRYVGIQAAKAIHKKDITLEEYLDSIRWKEDTYGSSGHLIICLDQEPPLILGPLGA